MSQFSDLRGIHPGIITLVAPGPSVMRLRPEHLVGPVIALYDAIVPTEVLAHSEPVYALQKDGCRGICPECENAPGMVRPASATLLLHEAESGGCFADYPDRITFTMADLDISEGWSNSAACSVLIARYMGATALRLVSYDACTTGDVRTFQMSNDLSHVAVSGVEETEAGFLIDYDESHVAYPYACECLRRESEGIPVEWVTP